MPSPRILSANNMATTLDGFDARITALEGKMTTLAADVATIKTDTRTIVDIVSAGKTAGYYIKRFAIPVATFLAGAGLLNSNLLKLITQLVGAH